MVGLREECNINYPDGIVKEEKQKTWGDHSLGNFFAENYLWFK